MASDETYYSIISQDSSSSDYYQPRPSAAPSKHNHNSHEINNNDHLDKASLASHASEISSQLAEVTGTMVVQYNPETDDVEVLKPEPKSPLFENDDDFVKHFIKEKLHSEPVDDGHEPTDEELIRARWLDKMPMEIIYQAPEVIIEQLHERYRIGLEEDVLYRYEPDTDKERTVAQQTVRSARRESMYNHVSPMPVVRRRQDEDELALGVPVTMVQTTSTPEADQITSPRVPERQLNWFQRFMEWLRPSRVAEPVAEPRSQSTDLQSVEKIGLEDETAMQTKI